MDEHMSSTAVHTVARMMMMDIRWLIIGAPERKEILEAS